MPVLFLIGGILLIVVAINDKVDDLTHLITEDFQPSNNTAGFHIWIVAIFVAGAIGYIPGFKSVANAFLVLIIMAILLSNKGFFAEFTEALKGV